MLMRDECDHRSPQPADQSTVMAPCGRWQPHRPPDTVASKNRGDIMIRRILALSFLAIAVTTQSASADTAAIAIDWPHTVAVARGQTVYFNAWRGSERINDYISWAGQRVAAD